MEYGKFIKGGAVYRIVTPFTPARWTNHLFNDRYVTEVSPRLQGCSSVIDSFTPEEFAGRHRNFYIASEDGVFSLSDIPEDYYCDHGLYDTELHMSKWGISADIRVFVPAKESCEVWTVNVSNNTEGSKNVSLYSFFPFSGFDPMGGHCQYQDGIIYRYTFPYHVRYDEKREVENNRMYSYVYSTQEPDSYDCDGLQFFGCDDYGIKIPASVQKGCCSNIEGIAPGFFVSAMQHKLVIEAGKTKTVHFIIGKERTFENIKELIRDFDIDCRFREVEQLWKKRTDTFIINTPDKNIDYMINYWAKKQSILLVRLNRLTAYTPVRNQLQDAIGYSIIEPYEALKFVLRVLKRQQYDGFLKQWYMADGSPERGLCFLNHSDGPIWLIMAFIEIIDQCADFGLYDHTEGYIDSDKKESIYEHLVKAARCIAGMRGSHGLCLMLDGDWTDPANGPGRLGKGESVWSTEASVYVINKLCDVAEKRGDASVAEELKELSHELKEAVNTHCFCDGYYIAGFDDSGVAYGTSTDEEGRIFLNTQVWAIISGIAEGSRIESIKKIISALDTPFGPRLLYPAFSKWNDTWGRISVKQPGTTENGAVYNHAAMFKAYSDCVTGDIDAAYNTIKSILPTNPLNPPEHSNQIPIFIPNYYYALESSKNMGKSSCNYSTGTVSWLIWVVIKHIIEPGLKGGLLPKGWLGRCSIVKKNMHQGGEL